MKSRLQLVSCLPLLVVAAASLVGACQFQPEYGGTRYRCPEDECPDGFECINDFCEVIGRADAAAADAGVDAGADGAVVDGAVVDSAAPADAPGVCDLAALAPDNDGCGEAITVGNGSDVYGDTEGYANHHNPGLTCTGQPTVGDDAVYQLDLEIGQTVSATMTPVGWDGALYLVGDCVSPSTCLAGSDEIASGFAESIEHTATAAQSYYLIVDSATALQAGCFTLSVTVD